MEAARCTVKVSGRDLRLARALQGATLVGADDLVLETLEKELPTTARAQRLVAVIPDGRLATLEVVVGGTQLLNGRPPGARWYKHLTQAVAAEIAIKLSSKGHLSRNLQEGKRQRPILCSNTVDRPFRFPYPSIRITGRGGFSLPRFLRGSLAGFDVERNEWARRLAEVGQLADDAARNDVEVVVTVVTTFVGDVVVADHNDILGGVLPQEAAGELSQTVWLEVLGERGPRVGGDVLPLDGHERRRDLVHCPSLYELPRRSLLGTQRHRNGTSAYRSRRYRAPHGCQWEAAVDRDRNRIMRAERRADLGSSLTQRAVDEGRYVACLPLAMSSATFCPPFLPISSKCSCPYFSETVSPPIFPMRP